MSERIEDLLARGKALVAQLQYAEALPLFEQVTHLDPRSFDAWANLGLAYNETGQHGPDIAAYDRALALSPYSADARNGKVRVLHTLGLRAPEPKPTASAAERRVP